MNNTVADDQTPSMNDPIDIKETAVGLPRFWQRPAVLYSFACAFAAVILIPFPRVGAWLAATCGSAWSSMGIVALVFLAVLYYTCYCCVLLFNRRLTTLHVDRLQLVEYFAYSAGLLGIVLRLEALSHGTAETIDPKAVMGALTPFKVGLVLWVLVSAVRWLAEHLMIMKAKEVSHES